MRSLAVALVWILCISFFTIGASFAQIPAAAPGPVSGTPPAAGSAPRTAEETIVDQGYRLGSGDKVRVIVFDEPSLTGEFFVGAQGQISLPLIGEVSAGGKTLHEFNDEVVRRLANGFLKDPHVSTEVLTYRPYYILGEVNRPGEYPYTSGLSVINAVATAGGFTYRANSHKVMIKRKDSAKEVSVKLTPGTPVDPGDTIRVVERFF